MKERHLDAVAVVSIIVALLIALVETFGSILYATPEVPSDKGYYIFTDYTTLLFDDSFVHEIDIQIPRVNWDYMVLHAEEEQYVVCDVVIDGERIDGVALRPKGNSSLKAIKAQGSDHFSFKIEFDHYRDDRTYHGLDKLALNNLGQDVSCLKDYLTYHMMNEVGIAAPLSSYAHIKVNGEDFGLYLAVEAIEDSFAYRNYGNEYGNIYRPECFMIDKVTPSAFAETKMDPEILERDYTLLGPGERFDILGTFARIPFETAFGENMEVAALNYVGDDLSRYNVFFDSSVFKIRKSDKESLVESLRVLNSDTPRLAFDEESVIKYFLVHNLVNNYDGYTGIFVHNYYIREKDGVLSMIPWDYNLSCGVFTMSSAIKSFMGEDSPYPVELAIGEAMDDGTGMVNYPIDTPTFTVENKDRPLLNAVLSDPELLEKYHVYYRAFLDDYFASGRFDEELRKAVSFVRPYVEKGETFYTPEHFGRAVEAVTDYFHLRVESIRRQLDGVLPSTMDGQAEDWENLVDGSSLDLSSSVTFDSLVFGIGSKDIYEILDAVAGDNPHTSEGFLMSVESVTEDLGKIPSLILRVVSSSSLIKNAIWKAVSGPILMVFSLVLLLVVRKQVIRYRRRKEVSDD